MKTTGVEEQKVLLTIGARLVTVLAIFSYTIQWQSVLEILEPEGYDSPFLDGCLP